MPYRQDFFSASLLALEDPKRVTGGNPSLRPPAQTGGQIF